MGDVRYHVRICIKHNNNNKEKKNINNFSSLQKIIAEHDPC